MDKKDFLNIVQYGNKNWKGKFIAGDLEKNAELYYAEFCFSNRQKKATRVIEELCRQLVEDKENGMLEAEGFLEKFCADREWDMQIYHCKICGRREVAFYSKEELDDLRKYEEKKLHIQDVIPNKPPWIREIFLSGMCMCSHCWEDYWSYDL